MLHTVKTISLTAKRMPLFFALLFAAVVVLLPISAAAQCSTGWDASGKWSIKQAGSPYTNDLTLEQKGKVITGLALTLRDTKGGIFIPGGRDNMSGTVDGTIDGDNLSIQIFWRNGLTGVYNGKFLPSGRLDGVAWEKASPNRTQTWYSQETLKCTPPPPIIPKPIKSSGKAKIDVIPLPLPAGMQCTQWDVSGVWDIKINSEQQKGGVAHVTFRQSGETITGKIDFGHRLGTGTVEYGASLRGSDLRMSAKWDTKSYGGTDVEYYVAKVRSDGFIEGVTTIDGNLTKEAAWTSDRAMKCVKSGPAPLKPPFITASQPIILPYQYVGSFFLGWDGGPDHPNVEVWLSIDNGVEIPAFTINMPQQSPLWKLPKAGGEMTQQRYHNYKYVLKDAAGKTLSTVTFAVP